MFHGCSSLTSVSIGNSVTSIGEYAFYGCSGLTSINIPGSVTSIGYVSFYGCSSLTSITIPSSVTSIGDGAFSGCYSVTNINVDAGNSVYDSRENCNAIIETSSNTLIVGSKNSIIPSSVTGIGKYAFYGCSGLTSVTIPNSVTSIGVSAFAYCSSLTDIYALRSDPSQYGCNTDAFYSFNTSTCTLHVPTGCKEVYASTVPWNQFTNVVEEDISSIEEMEIKAQDAAYYNLKGQCVANPQRGVNIIRYSDGTARKVYVK